MALLDSLHLLHLLAQAGGGRGVPPKKLLAKLRKGNPTFTKETLLLAGQEWRKQGQR
jgi:hypothetical protein